jgi:hypothetical protein
VYSNDEERGILFVFPYMRDLGDMVMKCVTIREVKRVCPRTRHKRNVLINR